MLVSTSLRLAILALVAYGLRGDPGDVGTKVQQATHQNSTLANDEAWLRKLQMVTITPKIRGGTPCPVDRFPYMVSIRNRAFSHICGGILLNRFWVLTAAHCLRNGDENPIVVAGTNLLDHGGQGQELFVTQSILHPDFTGDAADGNDIALMELLTPATKVKTFANLPDEDTKYRKGRKLMAIGWGTDGNEIQDTLDCSQALEVVNRNFCRKRWSSTESNPSITTSMVCALSETSDTCEGDTGGPLIDAQSLGGSFSAGNPAFDVIGGITSFGPQCGSGDNEVPGVYTFLPPFRKWILETMSSSQAEETNEGEVGPPTVQATGGNVAVFLKAADEGDLETVKSELAKGVDIESRNSDEKTALYLAAREGSVDVVTFLLDNGANVDAKTFVDWTPLHIAAFWGRVEVVRLLLEGGVDLEATSVVGETPLSFASKRGQVEVVQLLIDAGADLEARNDDGETPLFFAVQGGHLEVVKLLLDNGADIEEKFLDFGITALSVALDEGHDDVVEELVSRGADVNAADDDDWSPLHRAAQKAGGSAFIVLLVEAGAAVDAQTNAGETPLHLSARNGHKTNVEKLVDLGADKSLKDQYGDTPADDVCACVKISDACCCNVDVCKDSRMELLELLE